MVDLVTCKNEEDASKMKALKCGHNISPIISLWGFFKMLRGSLLLSPWSILPNFEPIQDFMVVLVTCKNKEELIKNEEARLVT